MKIIIKIIAVIMLLSTGCNDNDLKIKQAEAWNNLMPGSDGKTHILIVVEPAEKGIRISELIIKWEGTEKILREGEYSIEQMTDGEKQESHLKASFDSGGRELRLLSVEAKLESGEEELVLKVPDIKVENVY